MADIPLQFPNIGNALSQGAHAGYFAAETRQKADEEARRQAAAPFVAPAMSGNQAALAQLATADPKTFATIMPRLAQADANTRAKVKDAAEYSSYSANAILQAPPADRPAIHRQLYAEGVRRGYDMSNIPAEYSPAIDGTLRGIRLLSQHILENDTKFKLEDRKDARHNTQAGGGHPTEIEPLSGGGAPAPMPGRAPAVNPRVSEVMPGAVAPDGAPPQAPPVQTAQAMPPPGFAQGQATAVNDPTGQSPGPLQPEGVTPGSPPVGGGHVPPPKEGAFVDYNPQERGAVMRYFAPDAKTGLPRRPAMDQHGFVQYTFPDSGVSVYAKPFQKAEKHQGPEGPFAGQGIEAQYANILIKGDPSTPEYAQAYAHFAAPRTQVNENGQMVTIQPNVGHLRKPTYMPDMPAGGAPAPQAAQAPGGQTVTVTPGRGHPIPGSENEKISAGVTLISNLDKALGEYSGVPDAKPSDRTAGFISRNFGQLGDQAAQIMDPGGVRARALISDVTSQIMLARSGAAVTEGEAKRLIGMIPSPADKPQTIIEKLGQIRSTYAEMLRNQTAQYTPKNGFIPHEGAERVLGGSSAPGGSDLKKKYGLE